MIEAYLGEQSSQPTILDKNGEAFSNEAINAGRDLATSLRMQKWNQGFELIMLDLDGVLINGARAEPELISDRMIPALLALQKQNVYIGMNTACNDSVEPFFRQNGLIFDGPRIQENGQVLRIGDEVTYLTDDSHRIYIKTVKEQLMKHDFYRSEWQHVLSSPEKGFTFAAGRWNGSSRMSIWMRTHQEEILADLKPIFMQIAEAHGLDFEQRIAVKPKRTIHEDNVALTYVSFTQKMTPNDSKIDKSSPLRMHLPGIAAIAIADGGPGDTEFAEELKEKDRKYSRVLGIEETDETDKSAVEMFLMRANTRFPSAEACALALEYCAAIREGKVA